MQVLKARNAHAMLPKVCKALADTGIRRDSRNGPVAKLKGPVTLVYEKPLERVLNWEERDANPFLHLFESMWMLAGRNDVKFLADLVPRFRTYSDDGQTLHGAYGYRWRVFFGFDQLESIISVLERNPDDRRCVLQMWSPEEDLNVTGKDFPCNTQVMFSVQDGAVDMTVINRSNDAIFGAVGANVVHFSFLQEYIANRLGLAVGTYYQVSNNMHLYTEMHTELMLKMADKTQDGVWATDLYFEGGLAKQPIEGYYSESGAEHLPLLQNPEENDAFQWDLNEFLVYGRTTEFRSQFMASVIAPLWAGYRIYKDRTDEERFHDAMEELRKCASMPWMKACLIWVQRRYDNYMIRKGRAADDGVQHEIA